MQIFVCPKDWTYWKDRFEPDHMVSLQDPDADLSGLRPEWVAAENHHVEFFYDVEALDHPKAPSLTRIRSLIEWLLPRCGESSTARFLIHCDAGLGRSPAVGYIAWSIHLGPGREQEAFDAMKGSCLETQITPNSIVVAHADDILGREGTLKKPLTEWNRKVNWRRTLR